MFIPNHLHLLVRGYLNNPPKEVEVLNNWFSELVTKVGMIVAAGPTSVFVEDEGNEGLTGTITLKSSHSSIHIWDSTSPSLFQFDLYSCCTFSPQDVLIHLNKFGIESYTYQLIDRNEPEMKIIASGRG